MRVLTFENAKPALHFAHIVAQAIDRAANIAQVLKNNVIRVGESRYRHSTFFTS